METFAVEILRLSESSDHERFQYLVNCGITPIDTLNSQLRELIKTNNPKKKFSETQLNSHVKDHVGTLNWDEYGCWVYYPWRNTIAHILDQEEFTLLRTIRNRYKLFPDDQIKLRSKKIGIVGLSVGHSIAMAIAIESLAGEIRIADFDHLELSNLNRIRTSILNIGKSKTTVLAQEISELDPFIKIKCYDQGINKNNIASFFGGSEKLDLLIEECDSVDVKYLVRSMAKKEGIPVIMDTSDRGMIDIERYDIDCQYPILHGLIDSHLNYDHLTDLKTSKEKLPYILPFAGIERVSDKLALSALEVDTSITTWPQLGTEVQYGGALAAIAAKEVLLGNQTYSQRKYNLPPEININSITDQKTHNSLIQFNTNLLPQHTQKHCEISTDLLKIIIDESLLAPSASNLQPWNFFLYSGNCYLQETILPKESQTTESDFLFAISIGAIIENIAIVCSQYNVIFSHEVTSKPCETLTILLKFNHSKYPGQKNNLYSCISTRRTDRRKIKGSKLSSDEIDKMRAVFSQTTSSVTLSIIDEPSKVDELINLLAEGDKQRLLNKESHEFFYNSEIVFQNSSDSSTGINIDHLMLDESEKIGIQLLGRPEVRSLLYQHKLGDGLLNITQSYKQFTDYIGVIMIHKNTKELYIESGILMQRFWLTCESIGISIHPITSLVPLFHKTFEGSIKDKNDDSDKSIKNMKDRFNYLVASSGTPAFICRIFKTENGTIPKSKRCSIDQKLTYFGI